ncbi:MAG: MBL fold metallo-hydrolase [Kofleriaceae bacterium]
MSSLEIEPFYDRATSTWTYLVHRGRDAVIIDPVLDYDPASGAIAVASADRVLARVHEHGLIVHFVLETHAHADHLSASQYLKQQVGARIAIGSRICEVQQTFAPVFGLATLATDGSQFDRLLEDGDVVHAGAFSISVIATPGHTPACVSYLIEDAVFTGDALFVEDSGTGRCDFPRGNAAALYRSVHDRLYELAPETRVCVGHDYQPNGREPRWSSTIAAERDHNIQLRAATTLDEYVAVRTKRDATLSAPRLLLPSVQVNIAAGRLPMAEPNGRRYLRVPLTLPKQLP